MGSTDKYGRKTDCVFLRGKKCSALRNFYNSDHPYNLCYKCPFYRKVSDEEQGGGSNCNEQED